MPNKDRVDKTLRFDEGADRVGLGRHGIRKAWRRRTLTKAEQVDRVGCVASLECRDHISPREGVCTQSVNQDHWRARSLFLEIHHDAPPGRLPKRAELGGCCSLRSLSARQKGSG